MNTMYKESQLYGPVKNFFIRRGYIVKSEIKIGFCRADIVAFKEEKVVSVELKISDWKKAILQAKNYQLGSDYVYIAFPLMNSYNILRKAEGRIRDAGIGLLVVNEYTKDVRKLIQSKESTIKLGKLNLKFINKRFLQKK